MKSTKESGQQGIQTCHLCGKVQCGQRLGRVKCAFCSRIFCLQQLQRKFGIMATANDPNFKCPRCTGVCCCMCNCQKPPPHVHCKVYKVRQNKENPIGKRLVTKDVEASNGVAVKEHTRDKRDISVPASFPPMNAAAVAAVATTATTATPDMAHTALKVEMRPVQRIPSLPILDAGMMMMSPDDVFRGQRQDPHVWDGYTPDWSDGQNVWNYGIPDVPGIQNGDWLTQLNLTILDTTNQSSLNDPTALSEATDMNNQTAQPPLNTNIVDVVRMYFETYGDPNDYNRIAMEKHILERLGMIQVKAGKCDVLFKMLDSFNQNSIHVTVTWDLIHNPAKYTTGGAFPGLYTIIKHYPSILFTLDSTTNYADNGETLPHGQITITFLNTSTVIGLKPLCTSVALMDNCFRRFAEVKVTEQWSHGNQTWTAIGNIDTNKLKEMIHFGENAERILSSATNPCRICVCMNLKNDENYFEKLPLLSLILKRVVTDYPSVVFTLYRMSCKDRMVNCVVEFSETRNWVSIINSYESNIGVWEYKEEEEVKNATPYLVLLDL